MAVGFAQKLTHMGFDRIFRDKKLLGDICRITTFHDIT